MPLPLSVSQALLTFLFFSFYGGAILTKPFLHPAITEILHEAFSSNPDSPSIKLKLKDHFTSVLNDNDNPELAAPMVSMAACVAHSSLTDLQSTPAGSHKWGNFGANAFMGVFAHYIDMLNQIYAQNEHGYHSLMAKLLKQASQATIC
ncbi:hypothetical protein PAXRUDRAFT_19814 [Paxillus rubicundulus Ve08.2h10]|uniref:DUF6532 domain-containing protein n=1 Tax=Paxillus rubicundulus Ve08.2h10 TaxID=930991 RepID=A0A0D0D3J1_9AGAM|nr:hypothetical protein PAXRUDRAFT_19814 [Paxillus rubicundulus Ve08.2h10]